MALHKSMQGKTVDMTKLAQKNELTPAVSNEKINARGDKLGPGGQIIQRREEAMSSYYANTSQAPAAMPEPVVEKIVEPPSVLPPTKVPTTKKSEE
jgi:hypothetical protein